MFCAISGEVPQIPVVSVKSGHLFEKSLIEKYIEEHHKCPVTGVDLDLEDLVEVKVPKVKPRAPSGTSVPSLLALFQSEWDNVMLETQTLKNKYNEIRQELSSALYQYDAACRVIARLTKERDSARAALAKLNEQQ
ncbi:hypothetical protein MP638_005109 [Amoeboaphelidium occidentale]|nr:hypothetical protein MP638_005109 [Amoeboaphelidium occidentale]